MNEILHKNFHILEELSAKERKKIFILNVWKPPKNIYLIGCAIGLLCLKSDYTEVYLAVSKKPTLKPEKYFIGLKKDWLFYQQRDVYGPSTGINDLVNYHFLPNEQGFLIKKNEPLYIKVGVFNGNNRPMVYNAFCNLYYKFA
jgi:hypothetical protein